MSRSDSNSILLTQAKEIFENFLQSQGCRRTPGRFAILEAVYAQPGHFTLESLLDHLFQKNIPVSRASVYNTIELLIRCGLVRRRELGNGTVAYEKALGFRQHDHLVCTTCGKIFEFCDPRLQSVEESIGRLLGFRIREHNLVLTGECVRQECQAKNKP
ncbi:MAG: transcriptional repressor [Flavobacteriales bacterium]|nr:transcriptional repressor [Flavobacteriales bacterium]MCX7767400.1 transcriptional repressor [Flavobacteriales bacterium]MDW8410184.1 transcriptional repressor [Flavobacteriales bacterium]